MLIAGVLTYLALTLALGFWASRRVKTNQDFALAGKNLGLFMATSTVFATWFGSETVLGSSANFVRDGFYGVIEEPFGAALCLILVGFFFARRLYSMNLTTFGDFYRVRFGVVAEIVSSVLLAVSYVSWVAAQFLALGIVMHTITGIPLEWSVTLMAAMVTLYTTLGGMWAVSLTDTLQTTLIVSGLIIVFLILVPQAGGLNALLLKTPSTHFSFFPQGKINWLNYAALWMVLGLGSVPGQDVFQRIMSSQNARVAVLSSVIAGVLYLTIALIPLFLGLVAVQLIGKNELPRDMQHLLPQLILSKTPVAVQIIFFGALVSAILSTASGALLAPSVLISENLLRKFFKNDHWLLPLSRISTVAVALWALQMAFVNRHIHALVTESSAVGLVALLVPFLVGFFTENKNVYLASASMLMGYFCWLLWPQRLASWMPSPIAGLLASLAPYLAYLPVWLIRKISRDTRGRLAS